MASNVFTVNVYNINNIPINNTGAAVSMAFPTTSVQFSAAPAGTVSAAGVALNGLITVKPSGLQIYPTVYAVTQTVAALVTLANA